MWFNPIMKWLIRSPLHGLVSKSMLVIGYTGRKSGKRYETPMSLLTSIYPDTEVIYGLSS